MARTTMTWAAVTLVVITWIGGCDRKPTESASPPPAPTTAAAKNADWATVKPVATVRAMEALCRLCRFADVFHKGKVQSLTLTFSEGQAVDEQGNACTISAEEWKGILAMIEQSPSKSAAGRALPAKAHHYADGHGAARRHAYLVARPEVPGKLRLTLAKPLDDDSQG